MTIDKVTNASISDIQLTFEEYPMLKFIILAMLVISILVFTKKIRS